MEQENQVFLEETGSEESPFYGTPWKSDEEIYDYVINLRYEREWEWDFIKEILVKDGLQPYYADAIIDNIQAEGRKAKRMVWRKAFIYMFISLVALLVGIYIIFFNDNYTLTFRGYMAWIIAVCSPLIGVVIPAFQRKF